MPPSLETSESVGVQSTDRPATMNNMRMSIIVNCQVLLVDKSKRYGIYLYHP